MRYLWVFAVCLLLASASVSAAAQPFAVSAEVGLLYDFDSGQVLFSQNAEAEWVPASLVKIMTMYVAFDHLADGRVSLSDTVVVSERAWRMGGSQMFLEIGETVTIEDLLFGVAVVSGNDACVALAEALAGTQELFVRWMNDKASEMGLNLHFADVHGLSDENRVNAGDLVALIRQYLRDHPVALEYHRRLSFGYQPRSRTEPIVQSNRNGLLRRYEGTDGLKTGFLSVSGYNLVATAKRDGRRLIAVVLGAASERDRESDAVRLLDYGFRSFESVSLAELLPQQEARVYRGSQQSVPIRPSETTLSIPRGTRNSLQISVDIEPLSAPLSAGQAVGTVVAVHDGEVLHSVTLTAAESVEPGGIFRRAFDSLLLFFQQLVRR